jgi:hypothetical protein
MPVENLHDAVDCGSNTFGQSRDISVKYNYIRVEDIRKEIERRIEAQKTNNRVVQELSSLLSWLQ